MEFETDASAIPPPRRGPWAASTILSAR